FVEASRQMSGAKLRQSRQWEEPSKARLSEARPAEPRRWDEADPPGSAARRYVSPPPQPPQESAPASPQEPARRTWSPAASPRSDSIFDRPLPPSQPPSPAAREADAAAEHHSQLDAAPEDALGAAAEGVGGAPWAKKSVHAGEAEAPAPGLDRAQRFFDRLKFFRSEPKARQERMFEPAHEPR